MSARHFNIPLLRRRRYGGAAGVRTDPFPWVMWIGAGDGGAAQTNDFAPLSDFLLMGA